METRVAGKLSGSRSHGYAGGNFDIKRALVTFRAKMLYLRLLGQHGQAGEDEMSQKSSAATNTLSYDRKRETLASAAARSAQHRVGAMLLGVLTILTVFLLPIASTQWTELKGFILVDQTALIIAYVLSAWVLFAQFGRGRAVPLLLAAAGTLYTAAIVALQLTSLPGLIANGRLLGEGSETTIWLWTFWHIGPPLVGVSYAIARSLDLPPVPQNKVASSTALAVVAALALAGAGAVLATAGLPFLPRQTVGDDYTGLVASGVAPAVQVFTFVALVTLWRVTRDRRTVLELWLVAGLALLVLDNTATMAGHARASVGWYTGRLEALVSAFAVLLAYLHEVDAMRARAEAAVDEIARAEAALRQAQKMEAVGRLTGGIAHDFNNLLMVVSSGFDMIRRRPADTARVVKMAETGLEAVERGTRLTRQLLAFAKRTDLRPEVVNPNTALLGLETLLRRAVGESIHVDFVLFPGLRPTQLDVGAFESAVLNIVVNARDALPSGGGRIVVSTRNAERNVDGVSIATSEHQSGLVRSDVLAPGGYTVIAVSDTGAGMSEETLSHALEPFFTTKEFGKGSGLGLAQVWGFAQACGGSIEITSALGQGTTVEIWLPFAASSATPAPSSVQALAKASALRRAQDGEVVLAVEDEPAVLAAAVESLSDLGYKVIAARDAAEALLRLREENRIDVLFSDVVMPGGMNGVQLAVQARRLRPELRVVLTSGYTNEAMSQGSGLPDEVRLIAKPYRREELARLLRG